MCAISSDIGWNFLEISWKYLILNKSIPNGCVDRLTHDIFWLGYNIRQLQLQNDPGFIIVLKLLEHGYNKECKRASHQNCMAAHFRLLFSSLFFLTVPLWLKSNENDSPLIKVNRYYKCTGQRKLKPEKSYFPEKIREFLFRLNICVASTNDCP